MGLIVAAFAVVTVLVLIFPASAVDVGITRGLQLISFPPFAWLMTGISWIGIAPQSFIVTAVIVVVIFGLRYRWEALAALLTASVVEGLNLGIKFLVHRSRPGANLVNVSQILSDYSFPSGHVMFYAGFFGFLGFLIYTLLKPSWIRSALLVVFTSLVALVGLSRIYLGLHWASDVVGAYLLGSLCLLGAIQFYRWGKTRFFVKPPPPTDKP